ncbi:Signal transduction histidine kinase [Mucilaginibacter lappiensis]|uniref:histidine kinase n=1 Tax=Mucilaginibacter lappiensis TaxID=354630 RepID=A0ABR6PDD1_9SPHI|nr:HAMP domain-containing sensor histidine kinase [Mucilaginibacter lappiensis]MBB6107768.1 signal transduction histidine kinase [Mucilaginibacter lappiensis]SIP97773.1 Signal transduction histidine kinase [Mucilaginibacter lappiensis]
MKWFKTSFTYPLITLALLASVGLQSAWLYQLFQSQKQQISQQIDEMVNDQAKTNLYLSLASLRPIGNQRQMRAFFLSRQWQQIRMAYDDMNIYGLDANFTINLQGDTTHVNMDFKVTDTPPKSRREVAPELVGLLPLAVLKKDTVALPRMLKSIAQRLGQMGVTAVPYYRISTFISGKQIANTLAPGTHAAYVSPKHSYNFKHHYQYQLMLISLDRDIWYKMRYHVISALLMLFLTGLAFYYVINLYRKQQLYADAKADFSNNMTHEFKTPIATVSLALESIGRYDLASDPEKLKNYIEIGRFELQRLNLMVEKVLNINQQDAEELRLNLQLYEVQAGLQQVVAAMKLQMAKTYSSIEIEDTAEPYFVLADPIHLSNIFYNLIDNAIKYGVKPTKINIALSEAEENVIIRIADNGPGIAEKYQEVIFDRFFRIPDKGAIHQVKGSGLGLYYVKQTLERHGGSIMVISGPDKGATFVITLPAAK